jgi:hypothetical protein
MFEDKYDDGLNAARGTVNGVVLAVVFFWLPLALVLAFLKWRPW